MGVALRLFRHEEASVCNGANDARGVLPFSDIHNLASQVWAGNVQRTSRFSGCSKRRKKPPG